MAFKVTRCLVSTTLLAGVFCAVGLPATAQTQAISVASGVSTQSTASKTIESSPSWKSLTAAQQAALKPMQNDWVNLDISRKKKWLAVAQRYQTMLPADQARMHERMSQWAKLTPSQRSAARDNYSAVLSSPSSSGDVSGRNNLNEQWAKYQALSPEKKASLNEQANKVADTGKAKPLATQ
jgi:Protein of unknown function (DUF3106)